MTDRPDMLAPLRYAPFRYLVTGRFVTMLGNAVAPIALSFAVLDLTGSVRDLGLVVGARSLMNVLFLLVGGVIADRLPRERVIVVSGVLSAFTQATVATLVLTGSATVALLAVLAAANGIVTAFAFPATSALVPQTVPATALQQANALNRLGMNGAMILGASVGGVLVATVGPGWGLAADAASFAVATVAFGLVRVDRVTVPAGRSSTLRDLREGWREFTSRSWLWVVVLGFGFLNFAQAAAVGVLGPAVADGTIGRRYWGLVLAAQTAGMVLGALLALRLRVRRLLRLGVICMLGELPVMVALAQKPQVAILLPAALIGGLAIEQFAIAWESTMQRYVPPQVLARVYSYDALGSFIAIPLGQVLAGPAALAWGPRPALLAAAAIVLLAVGGMLLSRDVRTLPAIPPAEPAPPAVDLAAPVAEPAPSAGSGRTPATVSGAPTGPPSGQGAG
jgi:predicted MFS family arabinose efflux permease